jgi:ubiquinone/menaquinone biosynthesis C-methylase UbiE
MPQQSPAEQFLEAWHTRYPDAGRHFSEARADDGTSSLDRLMQTVPPGARVLDLACGTGALSVVLDQALITRQVLGVDLTMSELEIARRRAPHGQFVRGRVQQLPFADVSLDCVLCHMALMLFDDVDIVLREVTRVLRPGGVFGAVTNAAAGLNPAGERILGALSEQRHLIDSSRRAPDLGDSRTRDPDGLLDLVGSHFANVRVDAFSVTQMVPRELLWRYLTTAAYGLDALPDDVGLAALEALDLPDPIQWTLPLLIVQGSRSRTQFR